MHSNTRRLAAVFYVAAMMVMAACGDNAGPASPSGDGLGPIEPEPRVTEGQPELGQPDDLVSEFRQDLEVAGAVGRPVDGEILETVEPLDPAPTPDQTVGLRDGRSRNEAGELNRLDGAAALACSDVERALTALDDGDDRRATELVASAADRADRSTIDDIETWSLRLVDTVDTDIDGSLAPLLGFLSACTRGGYEL